MARLRMALVVALVMAVGSEATAIPMTYTVDADGGGDYTTIAGAIGGASNGDTIKIITVECRDFIKFTMRDK